MTVRKNHPKKRLVTIAERLSGRVALTHSEVTELAEFEHQEKENAVVSFLKKAAVPASLVLGFFLAAFSHRVDEFLPQLPGWTALSPEMAGGLDYLWGIFGEPIGKDNIIYHVPNFVLYSFGIFGLKHLFEKLEHRSWLDKVLAAQELLKQQLAEGTLHLRMEQGHSILFVGSSDYIGMQFVLYHYDGETVTVASKPQSYTKFWSKFDLVSPYDDLKQTLIRADGEHAGEYFFFPVKDEEIFLPGRNAYDLSPQKLDILCQNIRTIEKEMGWSTKPILIVGDRLHSSVVRTEDQKRALPDSYDIVSFETITQRYEQTYIFDPTDIVLQEIMRVARGRQIVFRATQEGLLEYKERFYERLTMLGYRPQLSLGVLTIGYDVFEDQTEQQTLARKIDDYYPVVLSAQVRDALVRNGYKSHEYIYVPDLVLEEIAKAAATQ